MQHPWSHIYPDKSFSEIDISENSSIGEVFKETFEKFKHRPAISTMGVTIDFKQFGRLVDSFSSYLQNHVGLQKGDRLVIMLPNIIQFPVAFLAAQQLGIVTVNTNPLYTAREMKHQFVDSGAKAIVILDLLLDKLEEIIGETEIEHVIVTRIGDQLPIWKAAATWIALKAKGMIPETSIKSEYFSDAISKGTVVSYERVICKSDDLAMLQYTGGTTGIAKGAMLTHGNILANMEQIIQATSGMIPLARETVLTALPLYHIFALTVNFLAFLKMGQHMVLIAKPVPIENTIESIAKYRPTIMTGVNTLFTALNNHRKFRQIRPRELKLALAGGMALVKETAVSFQKITGTPIIEGFGLTEASPVTHVTPLGVVAPDGSIGIPVASTEAKVVDANGKEVKRGEVGELIVRGPQVMKGYWKKDEETRKSIVKGWLYTGDLAKMDEEGWFYIVDRKKDMVIVSGFNVYPNEVESVLCEHPRVLEAAVVGVPDAKSGEAVKAFVVAKDDQLTVNELKEFAEKNLTNYKRPKFWELRKELPKSNVGKILRKNLRDNGDQ